MDKTSPMKSKPLVDVTCKLGTKGCFEDGRCHALGNCENKIVTNADRIRAMSDEELADKLHQLYLIFSDEGYYDFGRLFCDGKAGCINEDGEVHCNDDRRKACIIRWLQQPAEK